MPKTRIAAWIAGGALLLTSGVALAETQPEDPKLDNDPAEVTQTDLEEQQPVEAQKVEAQKLADQHAVEQQVVEEEAPEDDDASDKVKDNHGAVVSQAAKNHEFDEACGNHGAYVSSVAKGGDPTAPACAEPASTDAAHDETDGGSSSRAKHERETKERPAKPSGGKGRSGK
ncbi:MAG TPA: hypothetical protein VM345_18115 [Acidimicrobiales bacterium]|nr:hypothetical protein [Acidimicrobiales bacterium]